MKIPEGLKSSITSKILGKGAKSIASKVSGGGGSDNTTLMFKVIAKNFIALPGIARDLNVAKQMHQMLHWVQRSYLVKKHKPSLIKN